ncbi:hypothetical protein F5Y19DRAFT_475982 [Xylariaceae sp. FL1651]|nr:hypothetical protein F5Y19DRAFT_475982 [Xylariaceae sp. FL1651]
MRQSPHELLESPPVACAYICSVIVTLIETCQQSCWPTWSYTVAALSHGLNITRELHLVHSTFSASLLASLSRSYSQLYIPTHTRSLSFVRGQQALNSPFGGGLSSDDDSSHPTWADLKGPDVKAAEAIYESRVYERKSLAHAATEPFPDSEICCAHPRAVALYQPFADDGYVAWMVVGKSFFREIQENSVSEFSPVVFAGNPERWRTILFIFDE